MDLTGTRGMDLAWICGSNLQPPLDLNGSDGETHMDIADLTGTRGMDLVWIFVGSYVSRLDLTDIRGSDGKCNFNI